MSVFDPRRETAGDFFTPYALANLTVNWPVMVHFSDAAALVSEMDLVISIDTAAAHLAGALAKPVWIMLPFHADFRWLRDRADCPWYPTARLFRQSRPNVWGNAVSDVATALRDAGL